MIQIDGSQGEGGGQVLRTALALSVVTGQGFVLSRVRAGRAKPGLLRQHLTGLRAAADICGAQVEGDSLGSTRVAFHPGPARAGEYRFAVGSAGSASLVLQTVLPPLLLLDQPSTVTVSGGTHNSAAPPFHFLQAAFAPHVGVELELLKWGFYPAGGGELRARVQPSRKPIDLVTRGPIRELHGHAAISAISHRIGHGALGVFKHQLGLERDQIHFHQAPNPQGPGFACWIEARYDGGAEVFTAFGEKRNTEAVADRALEEFRAWEALDVPVSEHLADQLLIPLALFGGRFRTGPLSLHARTNMEIIRLFLPVRFEVGADGVVACGAGARGAG